MVHIGLTSGSACASGWSLFTQERDAKVMGTYGPGLPVTWMGSSVTVSE